MDVENVPVLSRYMRFLKNSRVGPSSHAEYLQWLRFYLDYCDKYQITCAKSERVRLFCEKLREKNQTPLQQQRAANAVSLYFVMLKQEGSADFAHPGLTPMASTADLPNLPLSRAGAPPPEKLPHHTSLLRTSNYLEAGYPVKSESPEWDAVLELTPRGDRCSRRSRLLRSPLHA